MDRRVFVSGVTGALLSLTGCSEVFESESSNSEPTADSSSDPQTDTPEASLRINAETTSFSLLINSEDFTQDISQMESIQDQHHLDITDTSATVTQGEETQSVPVQAQRNDNQIGEVQDGNIRIPSTQLPTGQTTLELRAQHQDLTETTEITVEKTVPETFKTQRQRNQETISNHSTPYRFDTFQFNQEQYTENRQQYLQNNQMGSGPNHDVQTAYEIMTTEGETTIGIENDEDIRTPGNINTNYPWARARENRFEEASQETAQHNSTWSIERFNELDTVEDQLDAIGTGVKVYQNTYAGGGAPSGTASSMAATIELTFEELTDQEIRSGGYIGNPLVGEDRTGHHGVMLHYLPDHDDHWLFHDTTADIIEPPEDSNYAGTEDRMYYALTDHDEKEQIEDVSYQQMKSAEVNTLGSMVTNGNIADTGGVFINDEWFESAADHILENGEGDPIFDPLEEAVQIQSETGKYVGLYGESLDDSRIMVTDDEEIYNEVMYQTGTVSTETLEGYCAGTAATES